MGYKYYCEKVLQKIAVELIGYKTVAKNVVKHGGTKLMGHKICCEKLVVKEESLLCTCKIVY